jgi:hypothetical protein
VTTTRRSGSPLSAAKSGRKARSSASRSTSTR